ncbi:diacylglycerol kinase 4-like isoform X1 [Papaver somniferum]|uniref:diacylglycerol kinase 4-like isoform X1 n=1 Tax=Papaver somniferum TaxID=3469 RepID=UPI000E6F6A16|nr:diacylglycerol kinase 4-like isoform X1 [Papaver somniferum]
MDSPSSGTSESTRWLTTSRSSFVESFRSVRLSAIGRIDKKDLRKRILIPEYLRFAMRDAILSKDINGVGLIISDANCEAPEEPMVVFVNSKSGGRHGPFLKSRLQDIMGEEQVFDLSVVKPPDFVQYGLGCLEKLTSLGDECAKEVREKMRIVVAGGDGTVGWVLGSLSDLNKQKRKPVPPTGIIPLGTGNDLSRSFGWVHFLSRGSRPLRDFSTSWHIVVSTPSGETVDLPYSLKPTEECFIDKDLDVEGEISETSTCFEGVFYNYYSIGMDAQVAYGFHQLRDEKPYLAQGPISNKGPQEHFTSSHYESKLFKMGKGSGSFRRGFVEAHADDGLLEIFGLKQGWHASLVMVELISAKHIAQAATIRLEIRGGEWREAYMQMDGEPWKQSMNNEYPTFVEIKMVPSQSLMISGD